MFTCPRCGKQFENPNGFYWHLRNYDLPHLECLDQLRQFMLEPEVWWEWYVSDDVSDEDCTDDDEPPIILIPRN